LSWSPCPDPALGDRAACDAVEIVIAPRAVDLGEMTVRRALPSVQRQMVGPFIFFDQMGPAEFLTDQGIDVRPHPHINLATLTYLFEGEILHRDSLGPTRRSEPGAVNWMRPAAASCIPSAPTRTSAAPASACSASRAGWRCREAQEESDPAFLHHAAAELPVVEAEGLTARVIAGEAFGSPRRSPPPRPRSTPTWPRAGRDCRWTADHEERAVYVVEGAVEIAGDRFEAGQLLILRTGDPHACAPSAARG
jgi:redox-sensitive bicupin YhaK (pirin superfamily)